jgi:hypothetical protein
VHLAENKQFNTSWKGKLHLLHRRKEVVREYYTDSSKWEAHNSKLPGITAHENVKTLNMHDVLYLIVHSV